jgi:hypothetical protein
MRGGRGALAVTGEEGAPGGSGGCQSGEEDNWAGPMCRPEGAAGCRGWPTG